ncbi:MAG: fumarylacetoacetate hydrolase family protein [Alphaproteobacteria bacterium]|nr:fumarylacetoacetate hydrolase family protein [Alphaproteobacteria bacterium]
MIRFVSYSTGRETGWGYLDGDAITDLTAHYPTMRAAIEAGALAALVQTAGPKLSLDQVTLTIPVINPEKIICVGVNYPDRNAEYKDGQEAPPNMSLFIRFPRSFTGHDQPLIRPPESYQLDYEGEVVIVIGKGGRRIAQSAAYDHIAGITIANEGTLRDWVRHAKFNVTQGKNFDTSGAIGPWLVPFAGAAQLDDIALETRVNGDLRQQDRTSRMLFPFRRIVEYISTFTTLVPGDVILCGTPTGAGARVDPPIWLKPGDVVEVSVEGIGTLRNTVKDEVLP